MIEAGLYGLALIKPYEASATLNIIYALLWWAT